MTVRRGRGMQWMTALVGLLMLAACGGADSAAPASGTEEAPGAEATEAAPAGGETEAAEDAGGDVTEVRLQFPNSSASISLFPFYLADDRGFFEENGLSVEFLYGPGSSSAIQQLVAGNAEIAMTTPGAVLQAAAEGFDVRWVYQHFYFNRFNVAVPVDSDIQEMADLQGSAIGISDPAGGEVPTVRGAIAAAGMQEGTDVEVIPVGEAGAAVQAMEQGVVAALGVSKPDVLSLQLAGLELRPITPDVVNTFPGDGIAVTPETLEDNPEMVAAFVRATLQGWAWSQANPDAVYDIVKEKYAPEQLTDDEFGRGFLDINLEDTATPSELGEEEHGKSLPESWTANAEFFEQIGLIDEPVDTGPLLVDDAVEAAWEQGIDLEQIRADAETYQP